MKTEKCFLLDDILQEYLLPYFTLEKILALRLVNKQFLELIPRSNFCSFDLSVPNEKHLRLLFLRIKDLDIFFPVIIKTFFIFQGGPSKSITENYKKNLIENALVLSLFLEGINRGTSNNRIIQEIQMRCFAAANNKKNELDIKHNILKKLSSAEDRFYNAVCSCVTKNVACCFSLFLFIGGPIFGLVYWSRHLKYHSSTLIFSGQPDVRIACNDINNFNATLVDGLKKLSSCFCANAQCPAGKIDGHLPVMCDGHTENITSVYELCDRGNAAFFIFTAVVVSVSVSLLLASCLFIYNKETKNKPGCCNEVLETNEQKKDAKQEYAVYMIGEKKRALNDRFTLFFTHPPHLESPDGEELTVNFSENRMAFRETEVNNAFAV